MTTAHLLYEFMLCMKLGITPTVSGFINDAGTRLYLYHVGREFVGSWNTGTNTGYKHSPENRNELYAIGGTL